MRTREDTPWLLVAALILFLLLLPLLVRLFAGDPPLAGAASALHDRHAAELRAGTIGVDALRSTPVPPTPHLALIALSQAAGVSWLLPGIIMIALLVTFALLLRSRMKSRIALLAVIAAAVSPTVLLAGTRHAPAALALLFSLWAIMALRKPWIAAVLFALASMTHPFTALSAALLAGWFTRARPKRRTTWLAIASGIGAGVAWLLFWGGTLSTSIFSNPRWSFGLYEFGAPAGLSIFIITAAIYGAFRTQRRLRDLALVAVLVALGLSLPQLALVATFAIAVFAASGIWSLLNEKWDLDPLRELLIVLFVCAGVFLAITAVRHVTQEQPDAELVEVLRYVGEQRRPGGLLTDPTFAPIVELYSGRHATLSEDADASLVRTALYTRDAVTMYDLLERTDTSFVLLTDEMRTVRFSRSDEGILFILPNTERFVRVRSTAESTLWYYINRKATAPVNVDG